MYVNILDVVQRPSFLKKNTTFQRLDLRTERDPVSEKLCSFKKRLGRWTTSNILTYIKSECVLKHPQFKSCPATPLRRKW
jgi:hypothetical protein